MTNTYPARHASLPTSGTDDDDDDRDDEHEGENEAPIREADEATEAPEEFQRDDEDKSGHSKGDDANGRDNEEKMTDSDS